MKRGAVLLAVFFMAGGRLWAETGEKIPWTGASLTVITTERRYCLDGDPRVARIAIHAATQIFSQTGVVLAPPVKPAQKFVAEICATFTGEKDGAGRIQWFAFVSLMVSDANGLLYSEAASEEFSLRRQQSPYCLARKQLRDAEKKILLCPETPVEAIRLAAWNAVFAFFREQNIKWDPQ